MADPDFSTRDHPQGSALPEGRPHSGAHLKHPPAVLRAFWLGMLLALVLCVVLIISLG